MFVIVNVLFIISISIDSFSSIVKNDSLVNSFEVAITFHSEGSSLYNTGNSKNSSVAISVCSIILSFSFFIVIVEIEDIFSPVWS
ncbi:hypothetical protein ES703_47909 [subsurface metagenome]